MCAADLPLAAHQSCADGTFGFSILLLPLLFDNFPLFFSRHFSFDTVCVCSSESLCVCVCVAPKNIRPCGARLVFMASLAQARAPNQAGNSSPPPPC